MTKFNFSDHVSILYRKGPMKMYALKGFPEYLDRKKRKSTTLFM